MDFDDLGRVIILRSLLSNDSSSTYVSLCEILIACKCTQYPLCTAGIEKAVVG